MRLPIRTPYGTIEAVLRIDDDTAIVTVDGEDIQIDRQCATPWDGILVALAWPEGRPVEEQTRYELAGRVAFGDGQDFMMAVYELAKRAGIKMCLPPPIPSPD